MDVGRRVCRGDDDRGRRGWGAKEGGRVEEWKVEELTTRKAREMGAKANLTLI